MGVTQKGLKATAKQSIKSKSIDLVIGGKLGEIRLNQSKNIPF